MENLNVKKFIFKQGYLNIENQINSVVSELLVVTCRLYTPFSESGE